MTDNPFDVEPPSMQEINKLVNEIKQLLHGKGPMLQGAALADLVAMFFAGHHPQIREQQIESWTTAMRAMIPLNEELLLEQVGIPPGWHRSN